MDSNSGFTFCGLLSGRVRQDADFEANGTRAHVTALNLLLVTEDSHRTHEVLTVELQRTHRGTTKDSQNTYGRDTEGA